jgi:AAA15 family ATPase/GTPase
MILEFSVENTYSIKDRQAISFEATGDVDDGHIIHAGNKRLLKIAAIYGANASGKSNMLMAFDFYIQFILDSFTMLKPQEKIPFKPFLFSENPEQSSGFFEIVFCFENLWYKYQVRLNQERVLYEYLASIEEKNEKIIFCFDTITNEYTYLDGDEKIANFVRPNTTFLSTSVQFNHSFLGKIYLYLKNGIIGLEELTLFDYTRNMLYSEKIRIDDIIRLFDKAGIDHISDIRIQDKDLTSQEQYMVKMVTDVIEKVKAFKGKMFYGDIDNSAKEILLVHDYEKKYILSLFSESMGTRRIFELAGPLLDCIQNEKSMFIDEIESSLHDDLLDFFIRTFIENTKSSQLIFTTHNQNLLDSSLLRNDEVWFAQKDSNGGSEFFSLAEFEDIPENVSRRELYKAGSFGALPQTSRFFKE